jgi:MFS family permease
MVNKRVKDVVVNFEGKTFEEGEVLKIRDSGKKSIFDGFFAGLMSGFGDRYISPYALFLGSSNFLIAILSTLPPLFGNFSQLFSIKLLRSYSRKKIVVLSVFLQAVLWFPLILIGVFYYYFPGLRFYSPIFLVVIYSLIVVVGSISGPLWNSWMRDLVGVNRGRYFGIRNLVVNLAIVLSMLLSGVILNFFSLSYAFFGFFIIFSFACISRFISFSYVLRQYEPLFVYEESTYFSFRDFISQIFNNNFGRFVLFVSLFSFATNISGPFFVVYQLKDLSLSYFSYTLISVSAIISMILFLPFWGTFSDKYGNIWVLKFSAWFIPLIPILWIFSIFLKDHILILIFYLISLEILSGFFWSGFNLSFSNFIYDAVSKQRMAICVAYFNFINAFFAFGGALFGSLLSYLDFKIGFVGGFLFIFLVSGLMRFFVIFIMHSKILEVREVKGFGLRYSIKRQLLRTGVILWRYIGFKPIGTSIAN